MKITLHDPPEGFEAEAEIRPRKARETYLDLDSAYLPYAVVGEVDTKYPYIILTPRKKKYWRLDPVARFESASLSPADSAVHLSFWDDGDLGYWIRSTPEVAQWLKVTECEE